MKKVLKVLKALAPVFVFLTVVLFLNIFELDTVVKFLKSNWIQISVAFVSGVFWQMVTARR